MRGSVLSFLLLLTSRALGEGIEVNGTFESGDGLGWTTWNSPWGAGFLYDYAAIEDAHQGTSSLLMSASTGSFGVYQEFCVESGVPFDAAWAWKGKTDGSTGWWEFLIIDGPYSYLAADDPANHPETTIAAKWEVGFAGAYPPAIETWTEDTGGIVPTSDMVTVVLKCGSTSGPVRVSFDAVTVAHPSGLVGVTSIAPPKGKTAGGEGVTITGANLTPDCVVAIGGTALIDPVRLSTCAITGTAPPGPEGRADVTVTTAAGTATLAGGYTYEATHRFLRGDCNGDSHVDISDAICMLFVLFKGDAAPAADCPAIANTNGDGRDDVSDVVYLLSHLFLAKAAPPAPYPACGTGDERPGCVTAPAACP